MSCVFAGFSVAGLAMVIVWSCGRVDVSEVRGMERGAGMGGK